MSELKGVYQTPLAAGGTAVGSVLKLKNPEGTDLFITRLILDITTKSTGAGSVDAGVHAAGTASSDNLIDGLDVNAAAGVFDNVKNGGSNGKATVKWKANEFLVITGGASLAGLVGNAYIEYVRV